MKYCGFECRKKSVGKIRAHGVIKLLDDVGEGPALEDAVVAAVKGHLKRCYLSNVPYTITYWLLEGEPGSVMREAGPSQTGGSVWVEPG